MIEEFCIEYLIKLQIQMERVGNARDSTTLGAISTNIGYKQLQDVLLCPSSLPAREGPK
jgi:hypothetical protein